MLQFYKLKLSFKLGVTNYNFIKFEFICIQKTKYPNRLVIMIVLESNSKIRPFSYISHYNIRINY